MDAVLIGYLTGKVMEDIRTERPIEPAMAHSLCRMELHDALRKRVTPEDLLVLQQLRCARDGYVQNLAISLLRPLIGREDVSQILKDLWASGTDLTVEGRIAIQPRLLDREDLEPEYHRQFFHFTIENWP